MESLSLGFLDTLPLISLVMPFYDYSYDSVRVVRCLCSHTRELWINNKSIISKMLQKQTITLDCKRISKRVINDLVKCDRHMLFKFKLIFYEEEINNNKLIILMLERIKSIEISDIICRGNQTRIMQLLTASPAYEAKSIDQYISKNLKLSWIYSNP